VQSPRYVLSLLLAVLAFPALGLGVMAQDTELYEAIEDEMQDIRELDLTEPLDITFMTRDEYLESLESEAGSDEDEAASLDDQRVLVAFGLLEPDQNPDEIFTGLIGEQVLGYYDPTTGEMVVILSNDGDDPSAIDQVTFAHETVHAIQDQNFDLNSFDEMRLAGTDDSYLAITGLIEGDATLSEIDYLLENPDLAADYLEELQSTEFDSSALEDAPAYFVGILSFPYNQGFEFAQAVYDEGGWDLLNEAYENPPTTSEQVLHPEKYFDGEGAIDVDVPDVEEALGDDWRVIDENTFGEYVISIMLDESDLSSRQVTAAHEGWGGDAYIALTDDEGTAIAWETAWDSDDDADEFFRALVVRESERLDVDVERDGSTVTIEGDDAVVRIIHDGDTVTYLMGPDVETIETMAGTI
jgi:hypothetical protein